MKIYEEVLELISASKTAYHAVDNIKEILLDNGYIELLEQEDFKLEAGKCYFVSRNDASIIAFKMPNNLDRFNIVASHLDSPSFKLKPNPEHSLTKYQVVNTEMYGGAIVSTWLDRPLGIGGRVLVDSGEEVDSMLLSMDNYCVIPNTAIHMNREINNGYKYNLQTEMLPIYSQDAVSLIKDIAKSLEVKEEQVLSFDLQLYPMEEATVIGSKGEFFTAPRIDNLECAFSTLIAFLDSKAGEDVCQVYASFNHEEVGSTSVEGANSTFLTDILNRIMRHSSREREAILASSMIISADNAHAIHPSTPHKLDPVNHVRMNEGIVIKTAANTSYTSDGLSKALIKKLWKDHKIKFQEFANNSEVRGGSTLGAISLMHVSMTSVDIGLAQLAMHSCVETAGIDDIEEMVKGIIVFYEN